MRTLYGILVEFVVRKNQHEKHNKVTQWVEWKYKNHLSTFCLSFYSPALAFCAVSLKRFLCWHHGCFHKRNTRLHVDYAKDNETLTFLIVSPPGQFRWIDCFVSRFIRFVSEEEKQNLAFWTAIINLESTQEVKFKHDCPCEFSPNNSNISITNTSNTGNGSYATSACSNTLEIFIAITLVCSDSLSNCDHLVWMNQQKLRIY